MATVLLTNCLAHISIAGQPCRVLNDDTGKDVITYLRELFYVPKNVTAKLIQQSESKDCFKQLVFSASMPDKGMVRALTLSPDFSHLSSAVYDVSVPPPLGSVLVEQRVKNFMEGHDLPVYGSQPAASRIVVIGDYEDKNTRRLFGQLLRVITESTGRQLALLNYPQPKHVLAMQMAKYVQCQWRENPQSLLAMEMSLLSEPIDVRSAELGRTASACNSPEVSSEIAAEMELVNSLQIGFFPTVFVRGTRFICRNETDDRIIMDAVIKEDTDASH